MCLFGCMELTLIIKGGYCSTSRQSICNECAKEGSGDLKCYFDSLKGGNLKADYLTGELFRDVLIGGNLISALSFKSVSISIEGCLRISGISLDESTDVTS